MSDPTSPPTTTRTWRVVVDMPVYESGRRAGEPVGWLTLNNIRGGAGGRIADAKVGGMWRRAAYIALNTAKVPRGLGYIEVTLEFVFTDRGTRDVADNFQRTAKPVVDALGPTRHYWTETRPTRTNPGGKKLVVELGRGVVPNDGPDHVVRPEPIIGPPLGRKGPVRGRIIMHIRQLTRSPNGGPQ